MISTQKTFSPETRDGLKAKSNQKPKMLRLMRFSGTLKGCLNGMGLNASAKISDFEGSRKFSSRDRRPVRRSRSATAGEEGDHFDKDMVPTADHSKFFANFFDRAGNETLVPFMAFHE